MKQLKPEEITKRISNEIKNKFDKETTATVAKNCDNVVDAITFTVEQMRQIPYNVRMFYCIVKERLPDIKNCVNQQTFLGILNLQRLVNPLILNQHFLYFNKQSAIRKFKMEK